MSADPATARTPSDPVSMVIGGDYCIGCGACAVDDARLRIESDSRGLLKVVTDVADLSDKTEICPFTASRNEDDIAAAGYSRAAGISHTREIGFFLDLYAGHAEQEEFRKNGSSGGMTTWLLDKLLAENEIDAIIHVGRSEASGDLFEYRISHSADELRRNSKSRYYPVHFNSVLDAVLLSPGMRYAFVGVPCHVKAVRLLCEKDARLDAALKYFVGIFCGHQKSTAFSELLAWQLGVSPGQITDIDFRVKDASQPANRYAIEVQEASGLRKGRTAQELYGSDWGLGFFKPRACDWCDDIAAETADIVFGDAWLPEYTHESAGTNIVITRHPYLQELIAGGVAAGHLKLDVISADKIVQSQAGNYRHRREGLSVRIGHAERRGGWHPAKRVKQNEYLVDGRRAKLYLTRSRLSRRSHVAFQAARKWNSLPFFMVQMFPLEVRYALLNGGPMGCIRLLVARVKMLRRLSGRTPG